jgi:hypothetical protein
MAGFKTSNDFGSGLVNSRWAQRSISGLGRLDIFQLKSAPEVIQKRPLALTDHRSTETQESSLPGGMRHFIRDAVQQPAVRIGLLFAALRFQDGQRGSSPVQSEPPHAIAGGFRRRLPKRLLQRRLRRLHLAPGRQVAYEGHAARLIVDDLLRQRNQFLDGAQTARSSHQRGKADQVLCVPQRVPVRCREIVLGKHIGLRYRAQEADSFFKGLIS